MAEDSDARSKLLARITSRRASVQAHLRAHRPRVRRLATVTVVLSSLAALFTAGPAVGGESFAGGVKDKLGLASDSYVWRILCLAALLVSVGAAILTNLGKSQDAAARLSTAEAVDGELEGLAVLVEFGQLPVQDAVKLYQQYTAKIAFIEDLPVAAGQLPGSYPGSHPGSDHRSAPGAGEPAPVGAASADRARRTRSLPAVPRSPHRSVDGGPPPPHRAR